ncbi:unnamed protein product [Dracunculus medinensis]|uniref:HTH_48 domain-containing protein n=1 Tax=Dracunculus medinensis TaxID=318479 RepID=A0A0N4UG12_DRAME|nr:unnamed protein product [Dracunculus medinensis]
MIMTTSKICNENGTVEQNSLLERHGLENGVSDSDRDNRKFFRLLHKATIIRTTISEMVRDINGVPIKTVKDRLRRWKEFFEGKLNHGPPFIVQNITDLPVEPYVCNCKPPTEEEITSVIHKLKINQTSGARSSNVVHYHS